MDHRTAVRGSIPDRRLWVLHGHPAAADLLPSTSPCYVIGISSTVIENDRPTDAAVTGGALCPDILDPMCRSVSLGPLGHSGSAGALAVGGSIGARAVGLALGPVGAIAVSGTIAQPRLVPVGVGLVRSRSAWCARGHRPAISCAFALGLALGPIGAVAVGLARVAPGSVQRAWLVWRMGYSRASRWPAVKSSGD